MSDDFSAIEPAIRLGSFTAVLLVMIAWETVVPRRRRLVSRWLRWPSNIGIAALNTVLLRIVFPAAATGFALLAAERGWGLFNLIEMPYGIAVVLSVVLLDLVIYTQHVVFHAVPALWRLHRMHHTDIDLDVTSGARFHPLEILLSMLIKLSIIAVLGPPALAVLIFEILLNATSMFNHANARLPLAVDRVLRLFVVTPDMHRVHHSVEVDETNSNFGFNLPWWDRLFGTYRDQPRAGHAAMTIGLTEFRDERELWLDRLLLQPLRRDQAVS